MNKRGYFTCHEPGGAHWGNRGVEKWTIIFNMMDDFIDDGNASGPVMECYATLRHVRWMYQTLEKSIILWSALLMNV